MNAQVAAFAPGGLEQMVAVGANVMAKRLTRMEREIRDHPEKSDFGDIPAARKIYPDQEKLLDDMRLQWAKDLAGKN